MRKLIFFLIIPLIFLSCENQPTGFDDFEVKSVYFSFQYPVRTLVFGDYVLPNESDENLKFEVGVQMGGVYSNDEMRNVTLQVDESLAQNLETVDGDTILPLPSDYYSLPGPSSDGTDPFSINIPSGDMNGYVEVQLAESFLEDTLAYGTHYVLPVKIVDTSLDSILAGDPIEGITNPNPHNPDHWEATPKDFVLYGIKYINKYDGQYLYRGRDLVHNMQDQPIDTVVYRTQFVVDNQVVQLETAGENRIRFTSQLRRSNANNPGNYELVLEFNQDNTLSVTGPDDSPFDISGSGEFAEEGDSFGGETRNTIYLDYQVQTDSTVHSLQDTLVMRDRGVSFETFQPVVSE